MSKPTHRNKHYADWIRSSAFYMPQSHKENKTP